MCKLIVSEASFKEVFLYDLGVGFFGAVKVDLYHCGDGQIIATSQDLGPQKLANRKGNGTPYFREI